MIISSKFFWTCPLFADKARLLSVSSPHAASWLSVTPSEGLGLHLNPQVAIKWWLGVDVSYGSCCPLCHEIARGSTWPSCCYLQKGVVMWFPATTNYVMSLQSPLGELIWVSRWKWVAMLPPITAALVLLTFRFQTGS